MSFLRIFTLSLLTLALTSGAFAQEVDYGLLKKFPIEQKYGPNPDANLFAKGKVQKHFPFESIQATNFVIIDSVANSLSYWGDTQEPFVYDPATNLLVTIKRGWADPVREPSEHNQLTSKSSIFVRLSSDMGSSWGDPIFVYDGTEATDRAGRYPSVDIFKINEGTANEDIAIAFNTTLVDEAAGLWHGIATGVYLVKDESSVYTNSEEFTAFDTDFKWGVSDTKIIAWPKGGESFNILGASPATPVTTDNFRMNNAIGFFKLEELSDFNETIPETWDPNQFADPGRAGYITASFAGFDKSPTGDALFMGLYGRLEGTGRGSFMFSKSVDEGETWSDYVIADTTVLEAVGQSLGLNPDSVYASFDQHDFMALGDDNVSFFFVLHELVRPRDTAVKNILIELNYNSGAWKAYKIADIVLPTYYTLNENNEIVRDGAGNAVGSYEIQAAHTIDNQKVLVKWVEPDFVPVTDTTWTFYSTTISYNVRNINGGNYAVKRSIENPAGDTIFHKGTWIPDLLPNDLMGIPVLSLRTALPAGALNTFQKRYLDRQYVTIGRFDAVVSAEDNRAVSNNLQIEEVYPNPAAGLAYASVSVPVYGEYKIEIYSSLGEKVKDLGSFYLNAGQSAININVNDMISGAYYLSISSGDMKSTKLLNVVR